MPFVNRQEQFGPLVLQFKTEVNQYLGALVGPEYLCVRGVLAALQTATVQVQCAYLGNGLWQFLICNQLAMISMSNDATFARINSISAAFVP